MFKVELLIVVFSFVLSIIISFYFLPRIILLSRKFKLFDKPSERKSHKYNVSYLGGIAVFLAVLLANLIIGILFYHINNSIYDFKLAFGLFTSLFVLVLVGLKDDLIGAKPLEKILFQILAATFLIVVCNVRILTLNGLFGVYYLSPLVSVSVSLFLFILLINAFNLVDGIDGLSASISILSNLVIGCFFLKYGLMFSAIILFSFSGATLSFLFFNFSYNLRKKIFLGDNGAFVLGLISSYAIIVSFNQCIKIDELLTNYVFENFQIIIITLVSYPLLDTVRVFMVRIYKGLSPFKADKNHMHHHLLKLNLTHKKSTLIVVVYTVFLFVLAFVLRFLNINDHFFIILGTSSVIYFIPIISNFYNK
ncbi:glycosyltransferase family 4 protein [Thalassobellus citreus]|uniref:glycosyltransferase family 4 protein n=1 Tax=Thalassobellus citreus TaxID=3367752 RepID=UPI0037BC61DC